ncbi:MAG TPA: PDZ domain-containing protein [Terracidiphilus sp.]|jgi:serine protease Do|nr:PDZ domain-containing protein [Terracidiphilus sp.]
MKFFLRPSIGAAVLAAAALFLNPPGAPAQTGISHVLQELNPLLSHAQGYLGVLVTDVDNDSVQKLRLKDSHGAMVTLIDHDAPAGSLLHINDVIQEVNGQKIEGAEQFGRMLKEVRAGQKVTMVLLRDGAIQTVTVQLVDRKVMEQEAWRKMNSDDVVPPPSSGTGFLSGSGDAPSSWHMPLFTSSLNVGALVEPLTSQMSDYLGVSAGIMVKQVSRKSAAAAAGLKPFDIIMKVGADPIATTADWDRALRTNEGRAVSVTVLRARKQQTVSMQVDSKHHSLVVWTDMFSDEDCLLVA